MLNYIVDFYCHELMLAIEVDGSSHEFKYLEDLKRQKKLEKYGVNFIRFSNLEIKKEIFSVEMVIQEKVKELLGTAITPPLPPSRGEFMDWSSPESKLAGGSLKNRNPQETMNFYQHA